MRKYGIVYTQFWLDKHTRKLSEKAKFLMLFLLTGPHTTSAGCFRSPKSYLAADLGWSSDEIETYLAELISIKADPALLLYCEETEWLLIPKFLDYNPIKNPNCGTNVCNSLANIPDDFSFFPELTEMLKPFEKRLDSKLFKKISNSSGNCSTNSSGNCLPNQDQDQEQEQDLETLTSSEPVCDDSDDLPVLSEDSDSNQTDQTNLSEAGAGSNAPALVGETLPVATGTNCPHDKIIDLYHEILPSLPRVRVWSEPNRKALRSRWRELKEAQNLDWWKGFFEQVQASDFLMGRSKSWSANLGWLIGPKNFAKVLNGQYENREATVGEITVASDPMEILRSWAGDSWLRKIVARGLAQLLADRRRGAPRPDQLAYTAGLYEQTLVRKQIALSPEIDGPRLERGFKALMSDTSGWPEVNDLIRLIPRRPVQDKIERIITDEERALGSRKASELIRKLGNSPVNSVQ